MTPSPSSPSGKIAALKCRLEKKSCSTPDSLAKKRERASTLASVELDARRERARRTNERHQEGLARKLRLEAAAVSRAKYRMEQKAVANTQKQAELDAKRVASAERQKALFEAVREAREARAFEAARRLAALSEIEARAATSKAKRNEAIVARSAARVRHAATVAEAQRVAAQETKTTTAANLLARLEAAADRRSEVLNEKVTSASVAVAAAEKVRVRKLVDEHHGVEARRARLAKAMERALGRRSGAIGTIQSKAAAANARVHDIVEKVKEEAAAKPEKLAHALAVKMQAAEVVHGLALKQAQASALAASAKLPPKAPVLIVIPTDGPTTIITALTAKAVAGSPPIPPISGAVAAAALTKAKCPQMPRRLLERLLFTPKLLLATASARQLAASGRRASFRALIAARAAHFGSVRMALALGRRAARAEIIRSLCELRMSTASKKAQAHLASVSTTARQFNKRVTAAKLQRSTARLALLNQAIVAEHRRQDAEVRRAVALQNRTVVAKAAARHTGFYARRQKMTIAIRDKGMAAERHAAEVNTRRTLHLAGVVACATRTERRGVKAPVADAAALAAASVVQYAIQAALAKTTCATDAETARALAVARATTISDAAAERALAMALVRRSQANSAVAQAAPQTKLGSPKTSPRKKKASPTKKANGEVEEAWAIVHVVDGAATLA